MLRVTVNYTFHGLTENVWDGTARDQKTHSSVLRPFRRISPTVFTSAGTAKNVQSTSGFPSLPDGFHLNYFNDILVHNML